MRDLISCTLIVAFIVVAGIPGCAQPRPESSTSDAQDAAAVRVNLDAYMSADPASDAETFFSQFTEDVHWIHGDQAPWVGIQGLRNVNWCHTLPGSKTTVDRVEVSGDLAYARGTYRLSLDCGDDGQQDSEGVFLSAHRRQQDGSWRIESLLQRE